VLLLQYYLASGARDRKRKEYFVSLLLLRRSAKKLKEEGEEMNLIVKEYDKRIFRGVVPRLVQLAAL